MRILFTRFPLESRMGGAEVQTLALMRGLHERGHDIVFFGNCPVLLEKSRIHELQATELPIGPPPVTKWGAVSFLWRQCNMKRTLMTKVSGIRHQASDVDAIVMLSLSEKLLLTNWAVAHGIRVVWIEHDRIGRWLAWNPWLPKLRRCSRCATTVCVSDLSRELYLRLGWDPAKTIAIPNGVDLDRLHDDSAKPPHSSPLPRGKDDLSIGCMARLSRDKGVDLLIEAMGALPDVTLTIVGTGPQEAALRVRIASLLQLANPQISDPINLVPTVSDLATFYRSCDVFILPSREHDPFGLVAAEAMACGIPVIVTNVCGIASYLHDGIDAIIVRAGSAAAIAEGLARLRNPATRERLAARGKETAHKLFSIEAMIDRYEEILEGG